MIGLPIVKYLAPNHCTISTENGTYLQSYDSVVALRTHQGKLYFYKDWDYSRTTLKYLKQFINTSESKASLIKRIEDGDIKRI